VSLSFRILVLILCGAASIAAAQSPEQAGLLHFEKHIRPALLEHCLQCHSQQRGKTKGDYSMDDAASMRRGGESGKPAIVPGQPAQSPLYLALTHQHEELQMPPKGALPKERIEAFRQWIAMGAADPRQGSASSAESSSDEAKAKRWATKTAEARKHWAFQPLAKVEPPATHSNWPQTDVDRFIAAGLEKAGLKPNPDTDRRRLIRRLAFDLTGLPPTADEIRAFEADTSPEALKRVVDQYLDSPRFGERWGRHWLDIARYAESSGKEINIAYPHAWRYRDYVIESLNADKPYNQFLMEQIAGDLLPFNDKRDQAQKIVATGFLALGSKSHNQREHRQFAYDLADEQIDAFSQAMLGLTVACARCHDHKFDPISQRDYYALAGIFLSSDTLYGTYGQLQNGQPSTLIELDEAAALPAAVAPISPTEYGELKNRHETLKGEADERRREVFAMTPQQRAANPAGNFLRIRASLDRADALRADLDLFQPGGQPRTLAMGLLERDRPVNSPLLARGEIKQPGAVVPRGLPEFFTSLTTQRPEPINDGSGRLQLARWIAAEDNPLTARVAVNRIWQKLMGEPLVPTADNFGLMGQPALQPQLLDHLAARFIQQGWSVKQLIRELLLSRSYRMSSEPQAQAMEQDPDNHLHWRMPLRRLEAEAIRDAMLAVCGDLDLYPMAGSPVARISEGREGLLQLAIEGSRQRNTNRSIYLPIIRDQIPEWLSSFDYPDASLVSSQRDSTNVPSQSLLLMNHPEAIAAGDSMARRLAQSGLPRSQWLATAWLWALGREPSTSEQQAAQTFFNQIAAAQSAEGKPEDEAKKIALSAFCHSLLASAEFRYLQ
jgi:cytochrome c553